MQEIRVHTDRRACISAPILKSFAYTAGLDPMPKSIYVGREPTGITLRWKPFAGSKSYDLSVRDRVLVGGFEPGTTMSIATMSADSLLLVRDQASAVSTPKVSTPKVSTPKVSTPKVSTPKVSTPKVSTPKPNLHSLVVSGLCVDVKRNHTQRSLLDVARTLDRLAPGIRVEDLLNAEGRIVLNYAEVCPKDTPAARFTKKAPIPETTETTEATEVGQGAPSGPMATFVLDTLRVAKQPLSILAFGGDQESRRRYREVLNALIEAGRVVKTGNTRATRYRLAK
jgi:hypothetical protein